MNRIDLNAKPSSSMVDVDFLKIQLDIVCAKHQESLINPKDPDNDNGFQASHPPLSALKESGPFENDPSKLKVAARVPSMQKKPAVTIRSTTSGSTNDEEAMGENNMNKNMDSSDAKRDRRMLSNREAARRSRKRKQAQLVELETRVSKLRDEKSSLLKSLTDVTKKYIDSVAEKRVLNAKVEALKARLKLAEAEWSFVRPPGLKQDRKD